MDPQALVMTRINTPKNSRRAAKAASLAAGGMRRDREKQLRAAYFPGATAADLASATGLTARCVRDYCKRLDMPLSKPRPQQRAPVVPAAAFDLARRKW